MHYIVTNGNAYAIDHPEDAIYGAPVLEDGVLGMINSVGVAVSNDVMHGKDELCK